MSSLPLIPLIPREVLFGNPSKASPQVSPDGKTIAYLAPVNNVLNVWVKTIGVSEVEEDHAITHDTYRGIRWFFWSGDSQHILYGQDVGGDENFHLYATQVTTRETRDLTPFENITAYPIHWDNRLTSEVLIALNKDDPRAHDAYRLNIVTGELTLVAKNPGNISNWASDGQLNIKAAWASDEMGGAALLVRENAASAWRRVGTWDADDSLTSGLDGLSYDGGTIFLHDSRNANAGRFIKMAMASGKTQVIAEDAHYDAGQAIFHPDTYQPQLISFTRARQDWVVLDEAIQADIEAIQSIQPGDFSLLNRDVADQT